MTNDMFSVREHWFASHNTMVRELFDLFVGERIGRGVFRSVYEHAYDKKVVIKFEPGARSFYNVTEWNVWDRVSNYGNFAARRWFAPCHYISPCGAILIQSRTEKMPPEKMPRRVPAFFDDIKPSNWGLLDGKPVCHDYGHNQIIEKGIFAKARKLSGWERDPKNT